jgi:hypothetical protein
MVRVKMGDYFNDKYKRHATDDCVEDGVNINDEGGN